MRYVTLQHFDRLRRDHRSPLPRPGSTVAMPNASSSGADSPLERSRPVKKTGTAGLPRARPPIRSAASGALLAWMPAHSLYAANRIVPV